MEHVKRRKQRFFLVLGLILLLIVTGLGMVYRVFDRYGDILLASEDDQPVSYTHLTLPTIRLV